MLLVGHARMLAEQAASRQSEAQLNAAFGRGRRRAPGPLSGAGRGAGRSPAAGNQDQAFEFGLDRILDGIEALIRAVPSAPDNTLAISWQSRV